MKQIAVVGSGVSGLGAAHALAQADGVQVTLIEADTRLGGHAHTLDVTLPDAQGRPLTHGVDTGFLVCNERTYPRLLALFDELGVRKAPSDMSFSVQVPGQLTGARAWMSGLQWCGSDLDTVFAQRGNLLSPRFWGMLADLLRFNRVTTDLALRGDDARLAQPIGEFLDEHRFGQAFREAYLMPMIACIWSCPTQQMLAFPVGTLIRFCHNHGLLQVSNRPQWYTVPGGSRTYIERLAEGLRQRGHEIRLGTPVQALSRDADGVRLHTTVGVERFDGVVMACHSDQALRILGRAAHADEQAVLGAIRYHRNRAVLHTDTGLLPSLPRAWAAWNYERGLAEADEAGAVCLHYLINRLQPLPWAQPVVVSLNPLREPRADAVLADIDYAHPVFDQAAIDAQRRLPALQGRDRVWFAGAWTGYGFHEDGLRSGQEAATGALQTVLRGVPHGAHEVAVA